MSSTHDAPSEEPQVGFPLPAAVDAVILRSKLVNYALDPAHRDGASKARVFRAALGIEQADWEYLRDQILGDLPARPVRARRGKAQSRWTTWSVEVWVDGLNGRGHWVWTAWKYECDVPYLVTVYIAPTGGQSDR